MIIPKEMIGRHASILLPGISTIEVKIKSIEADEIIGIYADDSEVHINHLAINVWWPDPKRDVARVKALKAAAKRTKEKEREISPD